MFLKNSWYVFDWNYNLDKDAKPLGRVIINQPIVVWRNGDGKLIAAEDRCPHRHAPLSFGRVEGNTIRCMYHGMVFNEQGECISIPMVPETPKCSIRMYPVVEKNDWIWVWTGDPALADESLIPDAWGVSNPDRPMLSNSLEYDANYHLINDNLCDLSHVDFVHETSLRVASGASWAQQQPKITQNERSVVFERWFENADLPSNTDIKVDTWISYQYFVPGIFVLYGARFAAGTAKQCDYQKPEGHEPIIQNIEQQAVTPISDTKTTYHYATGLMIPGKKGMTDEIRARMAVVMKTFGEDKDIIEAQQKIWDLTDPTQKKLFLAHDQGPTMIRRMIDRFIAAES